MVVFLAGCSAQGASDASGDAAISEERADAPPGVQPQGAPAPAEAQVSGLKDAAGLGIGDSDTDDAAAEADVEVSTPDTPPITTGERIIKEGTITIEVKDGDFDVAFQQAVSAATRFGGDVIASSSKTDDEGNTSGSVTLRVPVDDFEELMTGVGEIGTVVKRDVGSTDVTAEFTDLESRLRHLQAQERFYLGLLDRAEGVRDAIAVQQQVDGIQSEIEKIQGRLNVLDDRTTYSTLTVMLFEPGLGVPITDEDPETRPTLARYWDTARDAFVNVVGALLVGAVFLAPLLVVLGAGVLLWTALRRRPQRELPPSAAAERSDDEPPVSVG
jgi:hypothetical protein